MNIEFDEAREYFLKRIKTLEKRLYHADRRGNDQEISDLRRKIKYCREAIRALGQPEIVWCKDCRFYRENEYATHWCSRGCEVHDVRPDDFCSHGGRKDHAETD